MAVITTIAPYAAAYLSLSFGTALVVGRLLRAMDPTDDFGEETADLAAEEGLGEALAS